MKIENTRVIVILTGEDSLIDVPSAEAQIKTAHEGDLAIDKTKLLVVGPIQDDVVIHAI